MSAFSMLALVRRFWWAPIILALGIALLTTRSQLTSARGALRAERDARKVDATLGRAALATAEASFARQQATAITGYADRLASREPIIIQSTDTVRTYAQTDAGRVRCLGPDRVRGLDALDGALFAEDPARTGAGDDPVPPDADRPPAGR